MTGLPIVTHQQRLASATVKMQIYGPPKIGKTRLIRTCNPNDTLFMDCERGMQSVRDWPGASIHPQSWEDVKDMTCFLCGPDPTRGNQEDYSAAHFQRVCNVYGQRDRYPIRTLFIDSTTKISQWALAWSEQQPDAKNAKGKKDTRGMYGVLSRELTPWAWRLHENPVMNVVLIGGIKQDEKTGTWKPMVDGGSSDKFPYIFDLIATMANIPDQTGNASPGLVCQSPNPWGYPAGGRFSALNPVEAPDIEGILAKIASS